ncbi:MAG: hypothetical protein ABJO67_04130 [Pseudoruegeria sp.]
MNNQDHEGPYQVFTVILSALGLAIEPVGFVVAMVVSLSMSLLASRKREESRRGNFWMVLLSGLTCSVLAAMLMGHYYPDFPIAIALVLGGLLSSFALNIYVGFMTRIEDKAAEIADRAMARVLPKKGDDE